MNAVSNPYPVTLRDELTAPPGRGWCLLKWLVALPHYIVLCFLWIAFFCVIAFFAILFTGKYPKSLFDFNAGVLRWSWRVVGMNRWSWRVGAYATPMRDEYPPFRLWDD